MALKLITAPVTEPISLEDAKLFLRLDADPGVEDTLIEALIIAARQKAEAIISRQLITATWEMRLDRFPCYGFNQAGFGSIKNYDLGYHHQGLTDIIYLPYPPLQSVDSIKYLDESGTEQTLIENTDYLVDTYSEPARITPAYNVFWPFTRPVVNAVRIVFTAGYGDAPGDVPEAIMNWIKALVGSLWENRETVFVAPNTVNMVELGFLDGLLDEYKMHSS